MKFVLTESATPDEARQEAIDWQATFEDKDYSYGELLEWQSYFTLLGERFGLTEEFKENGIL